jgi:hypothetical protein
MMTATTKTVNYTQEQTTQVVEAYKSGTAVEQIAQDLGKSTRSIVAKLSREGVYQPKTKAKGETRVKKAELVDRLAAACDVAPEVFESLEKANYEVLELLLAKLSC